MTRVIDALLRRREHQHAQVVATLGLQLILVEELDGILALLILCCHWIGVIYSLGQLLVPLVAGVGCADPP